MRSISTGKLGVLIGFGMGASAAIFACVGDSPVTQGPDAGSDASGADVADTGPPSIIEVAAGRTHACALASDGAVYCWGDDSAGQAGLDPAGADVSHCDFSAGGGGSVPCVTKPTRVAGLAPMKHLARRLGEGFSCAYDDTAVYCWGQNDLGQLGHAPGASGDGSCKSYAGSQATQVNCNFTPQPTGLQASSISQVASSWIHSCAVAGGQVYCWGDDSREQLGTAAPPPAGNAFNVKLADVAQVSAGGASTCAVNNAGDVFCWGSNLYGQLGHPPSTAGDADCQGIPCTPTPSKVPLGEATAEVETSGQATYFRNAGQSLLVMGTNANGEYATASTPDAGVPVQIPGLQVSSISADFTECVVDFQHNLKCWGRNDFGALGPATPGAPVTTPVTIISNQDTLAVSTSNTYLVALTIDHKVLAAGDNTLGELGHAPGQSGDTGCGNQNKAWCNSTPVQVTGLP